MKINRPAGKNRSRLALTYLLFISVFLFLCSSSANVLYAQDYSRIEIQCVWTDVDKIVVVGDLHGAYDNFVKILKQTGLVDDQLQWIGGETHLVQMGDILDRGDRARDIFDLLIRLEESAKSAGGFVHVLIGNHEEMNLADTAFDKDEYITVQQFISFVSDKYINRKKQGFGRLGRSKPGGSLSSELGFTQYLSQVIEKGKNKKTHVGRRSYYRNLNRTYGRWILNHNVVVKINDIIFVHAGISETYSEMKRYGGKVWAVDTGISDFFLRRGGFVGALIYEKGKFFPYFESK